MGAHTHFFYALSLPEKIKEELNHLCNGIKGTYSFSRWIHEKDYHITLAFLGSAPKDKLELSQQQVVQHLKGLESFSLTINHLGSFGKRESPRIFWAGVQNEEKLHIVRNQVFTACQKACFQLESRPFHPHITIARKWEGESPFPIPRFEEENKLFRPLIFTANEVKLYQTHLDRNPKYETVETYSLDS